MSTSCRAGLSGGLSGISGELWRGGSRTSEELPERLVLPIHRGALILIRFVFVFAISIVLSLPEFNMSRVVEKSIPFRLRQMP